MRALAARQRSYTHGTRGPRRDAAAIGSLDLVVAAIAVWNTVYRARVVDAQRERESIDDSLLRHLSPLQPSRLTGLGWAVSIEHLCTEDHGGERLADGSGVSF